MGEDKDIEKHKNKAQIMCISNMEIIYVMLKYPDVVTNIVFIKLSTLQLYLWAGIIVHFDTETEDGAYVITSVEAFWGLLDLDKYRLHTKNQLII